MTTNKVTGFTMEDSPTVPLPQIISSLTTCIVGDDPSAHVLIPFLSEAGHHVQLLLLPLEEGETRPDKSSWHDVVYCHMVDRKVQNDDMTASLKGRLLHTHAGTLHHVYTDPAEVIPQADIIVLCMPVHHQRSALHQICPHIMKGNKDKPVFLGTLNGQAGFNWMVRQEIVEQCGTNRDGSSPLFDKSGDCMLVTFACSNLPWACRVVEYGEAVANYGGNLVNWVAVHPQDKFHAINEIFLKEIALHPMKNHAGSFQLIDSFLSLPLMSLPQVLVPPARSFALWQRTKGKWSSESTVPSFYGQDFDTLSAEYVRRLDEDYQNIRQAFMQNVTHRTFPFLKLNYLDLHRLQHGSLGADTSTPDTTTESLQMKSEDEKKDHDPLDEEGINIVGAKKPVADPFSRSIRSNEQLAHVKTPTIIHARGTRKLDVFHDEFFTDAVAYGLIIAKAMAEMLMVETPTIDEVIIWAQQVRGEKYLDTVNNRINPEFCLEKYRTGIPQSYGLATLEDVLAAEEIQ